MEYTAEKAEYQADAATCNACPLKAECTPSPYGRQVHRSFHADYLERVKSYDQTEAYQRALRKRKVWVEPLFAEAKEWHGMRRFLLRRIWRVNCEALVIAAGQNLKRLLKKRGWGRRLFPAEAVATVPPDFEPVNARVLLRPNNFDPLFQPTPVKNHLPPAIRTPALVRHPHVTPTPAQLHQLSLDRLLLSPPPKPPDDLSCGSCDR